MKISDLKILVCKHDIKRRSILIISRIYFVRCIFIKSLIFIDNVVSSNQKCFLSEYITGENHNIITKENRQ